MPLHQYAIILILLGATLFFSALSRKSSLPYPVFLVIAGVLLGFVPAINAITLHPDIIFLLFLPPLLYDAAAHTKIHLFKRHIGTISVLAFSLVILTTLGVASIAHYLVPGISRATGFLLGAILSATDAVAALTITKGLPLSDKTVSILEGESLINDASALTAYHFALAASFGAGFVFRNAGIEFLIIIGGGILIGRGIARVLRSLLKRTKNDEIVAVSFTLLTPFIAYLVSESLNVSGVIAVVVLGIITTNFTKKIFPTSVQQLSGNIRSIITFLLNGFIFLLIGLNFHIIINNLPEDKFLLLVGYGILISLGILIIRLGVIFFDSRWREHIHHHYPTDHNNQQRIEWQSALTIGFSGMRGIVSLAIAFALPVTLSNGKLFDERATLIFLTIIVVLVMLIIQGTILPYVIKSLHRDETQ